MDLVKHLALLISFVAVSSIARADGLSLTIGNSVAGQNYMMKSAQFVFRLNGCADLSKAQVTATAESLVGGVRHSMPLQPVPAQTQAGVYAIADRTDTGAKWMVAITANCQNETAGAIVPVNARSFVREGTQLLQHAPSAAEIETALKAFSSAP